MAETLTISIPIQVTRLRHGHQRFRPTPAETSASLVVTLARAYAWQQMLLSGAYTSMQHLATSLGCKLSYVSHVMNYALLAPDITEAILTGRLPHLTIQTMPRTLPLDWRTQRVLLGVPAPEDEEWECGSVSTVRPS